MEYLLISLIGAVAIIGMRVYSTYNRLIALDERCNTSFADIDVQMKHRHSVIPNLVETVKGFANHESDILKAVTDARASAMSATGTELRLEAEARLGNAINSMITTVENYPEIKASSHFLQLRQDLNDVENRITASRRFFNITIDEFNATIRQFPGSFIGKYADLRKRKHFDLGAERIFMDEPVAVNF